MFIFENGYPGVLPFLRMLKQEDIKPSGIYEVPRNSYNIADYTTLYEDFNVILPSYNILIISSVDLDNNDV